jgi:hypothetical protein
MSTEIPLRPVLPRNLTARADHLVEGNPMIARPESGVGNAHPGLEFDVRVLDRHFLPGLVFDFQYGAGAKLSALKPGENPALPALTQDDLKQDLFLLLVKARFGKNPAQDEVVPLAGVDGYLVLRTIIDLEPGRRTVVVGPLSAARSGRLNVLKIALETGGLIPPIVRDDAGKLVYAIVTGTRNTFLTSDGVIDPDLIPPGELTQNLCSPWQWDFADCYCYYWASSKPDIVVGITGEAQVLNFQRDRTAPEPAKPASTPSEWMAGNMSEADLILNWETLPIVTSDREGVVPRKPEWPLIDLNQVMTLEQIADALPDLAALEHALCVEYLYAKYSIAAPASPPTRWRRGALRRYQAQQEIFNIAIDEMRHFRWVNEMLRLLDRPPALARADVIGRDLRRMFSLRTLQPDVLDQFIAIEAPSSIYNDDPQQLDGMYTRILVSLHHISMPKQEDLRFRLKQLVKTIIDEGGDHWDRFRRVKTHLAGQKPSTYLHKIAPLGVPAPAPWSLVQNLCDTYYVLLLQFLFITFMLDRMSRGRWLGLSHLAMFALDASAALLVRNGFGPRFTRVDWPGGFRALNPDDKGATSYTRQLHELIRSKADIEELFRPASDAIGKLGAFRQLRDFASDQKERLNVMKKVVETAFSEAAVRDR